MLGFFLRRKATAKIQKAAINMADALQEEGVFIEMSRKDLAQKRSQFVKQVVYSTKKSEDIEFSFPDGARLVIDTRKKGKEFVFSEVTIHANASGSNYRNLHQRLNELAIAKV